MSAQRSMISDEAGEAVLHYKRKLSRHLEDSSPDIVLHCLDKLEQIPVNISILQDTGIGKVVNHLKKSETADESVIEKARSIVLKWKEIVANEEQELSQQQEKDQGSDEHHRERQESESDASDDSDDEDPPVLSPEVERAQSPPPPSKASSSSKHSSSKMDESSKKSSSKREEDTSAAASRSSKSSSKEKEKSSSSSSSSNKHKHVKEEVSSSSSKKKKKDKDREKEKEKEKEKLKEKEKNKRTSSGVDDKKRKDDEDSGKSRKRKHESSLSEEDGEKARKRKQESDRKHQNSIDEKSKKSSSKKAAETNGFEAALLGEAKGSSSKSDRKDKHKDSRKKSETSFKDDKQIATTLPPPPVAVPSDLNPNYQPQKNKAPVAAVAAPTHNYTHLTDGKTDDEALSALISMSKNAKRTAVYSGSKRSAFGKGSVPRLSELCIHKLQEHVELLDDCRAVKFKVLEPVLERAKPETLMNIEDHNPYLMEDTGTLWERICRKQFPKEARQEFEAWREMYERCTSDRKKKLDFLSNKLNNSYKNVKDNERKTKLAYVDGVAKAPRNFQRAQDKNGTGVVSSTQAMRKLTGPPSLPKSAREVGSSGGGGGAAGPPAASKKPKVAPMMAKTLKMVRGLKVNFRR